MIARTDRVNDAPSPLTYPGTSVATRPEGGSMNRKFAIVPVLMVFLAIGCGSMNRVLPSSVDAKAMEADVRGKIAEAVPSKTFAIEITVDDHAVVTLEGHAANSTDVAKIGDAAKSVSGVKRVINHVHVQ
jgi:hypothetical protein